MLRVCEKIEDSPQEITIKSLRVLEDPSAKTEANPLFDLEQSKIKVSYYDHDFEYDVLPLFHDQYQLYNPLLSLKLNKFLHLRWHKFLNDAPKGYPRILLFREIKHETPAVRRKILNCQPYDWNNKLAPLPFDHPDNSNRVLPNKNVQIYESTRGRWL